MGFSNCSGRGIILPSLVISCFFKGKVTLEMLKGCLQYQVPLGVHNWISSKLFRLLLKDSCAFDYKHGIYADFIRKEK